MTPLTTPDDCGNAGKQRPAFTGVNVIKTVMLTVILCTSCSMAVHHDVEADPGLPIACDSDPSLCCTSGSPIIVDLGGDGIHLGPPDAGVLFALRDGASARWSWTLPGTNDAWLALDRNGNGVIDDGGELFGDVTDQPVATSPNGFSALAVFDTADNGGNADGMLDAGDAVWGRLRLWRDADANGISGSDEMIPLDLAGVRGFSLSYAESSIVDMFGNQFRYQSAIVADPPVAATVSDVWLQHVVGPVAQDYTQWTCYAWGYAVAFGTTGSPSIYTGPCGNPYTQSDPYVTDGLGQLAKLVIRSSTSTSIDTAFNSAYNITSNAILGQVSDPSTYWCKFSYTPSPDLAEPLPWDKASSSGSPGVKCISQIISSGGGGTGGGDCR